MKLTESPGVNILNRMFWLILNLLFGGFTALILLIWVSCDMEMPTFFFPLLTSSPFLQSIFHLRWLDLHLTLFHQILFNACLFGLFGFVHTFFARDDVQHYFTTKFLFPSFGLRTFYLILTNISAWIVMGFWQHTSIQLWDFLSNPVYEIEYRKHKILLTLFSIINLPGMLVIKQFSMLQFFGIKQIFQSSSCLMNFRTTGMNKLVTDGMFHYCRHPMYLFLLVGYILSPCVSLDKFLFVIYTIGYLYIAIPIEEKKLEVTFGPAYIAYKKCVPAVLPRFEKKNKLV
ncbi:unnamed protein product [Adineta ricciae]|uniref:Nuclear envelope membrane protein n=1 Tax=Adineta ricciae TaxID=249248 RepID=A0A814R1D9_ADIRI|nr:unnamed protein product [Adineta ricciae]